MRLFVLFLFIFFSFGLQAATKTASVSGNWNNAATWGGAAAPVSGGGDDIVINTGITVTMTADYTTSATLTLNGTGTIQMAGYNLTVGSLTAAGSAVINNGGAAKTLTVGSLNTNTTYTGTLTNAINLVKSGSGTFTFSPTGTLSFRNVDVTAGTVNITSGTITLSAEIEHGNRLRANGGTLTLSGGSIDALGGYVVAGFGANGTINFSGCNVTADALMVGWNGIGTVTVSAGTLDFWWQIRHYDGGTGTVTINGGTVICGDVINTTGAGNTNTDYLTINVNAGGTLQANKIYVTAEQDNDGNSANTPPHTTNINLNGGTLKAGGTYDLFGVNSHASGSATGQVYVNLLANSYIHTNGYTATLLVAINDAASSFGITKQGTGTLVYAVNNTYDGATTISTGTLQVGNGSTTGSIASTSIVNNATLTYNRSDNITISAVISGTGALTKEAANTLTLSGANTYTGATTVNAGTLKLGAANVISNSSAVTVAAGAVFDMNTFSETVSSIAGAGTIDNVSGGGSPVLTCGNSSVSTTFSGIIQGSLSIVKNGTYALILSGPNTFSGGFTINAGTIRFGSASALGSTSGTFTINAGASINTSGGSINLNAYPIVINGSFTFVGTNSLNIGAGAVTLNSNIIITCSGSTFTLGGIISGNYTIEKTGAGTLVFSGANNYTGTTTLTAGTLRLGASGVLPDAYAVTVNSGATLDMYGFNETVGSIAGAGTIDNTSGSGTYTLTCGGDGTSTTFSGTMQNTSGFLNLTKAGSGTFTLSGANTNQYLYANAGTVSLTNTLAVQNSVYINGGTLQVLHNGTGNNGTINFNANVVVNSGYTGTIYVANNGSNTGNNVVFSSSAPGNATLNITGANNYSVTFTTMSVSGGGVGTAILNPTSANLLIGTVTSGNASHTLQLDGTSTGNIISGTISDNGAWVTTISKTNTGTWTLSGTNTYSGTMTISAGTLKLGSSTALSSTAPLALSGTGILDLNTFSNSVTNISSSVNTATITDNAAGAGTSTLTISAFTNTIACLILDGSTRIVAIKVANANTSNPLFTLTNANTFSGGLTLMHNATGTRLRINGAISNVGTAGAITSSPLGRGAIYIGESATDKAGVLFDTYASNTLLNPIVFNTILGTDQPGFRVDAAATGLTLAGTITANLSDARFFTPPGSTAITITGQITGSNGLELNTYSGGTLTVTLNNSGTANNYSGATTLGHSGCTLKLGRAAQIPDASAVTVTGTLDMNTFSETVGSIAGAGTIDNVAGGGNPVLTCGGDNSSTSFTGTISNTSSAIALIKSGSGTLSLNTGTFTIKYLDLQQGTIGISSGTFNFTSHKGNQQAINIIGNSILNISGGTLSSADYRLVAGFGGSDGTLNISGGTINFEYLVVGWNSAGTVNISGGTSTFDNSIIHNDAGNGSVLTLTGGTVTTPLVRNNSNGTGTDNLTINLNAGGSLTTTSISAYATSASGTHYTTLNLAGGTLTASGTGNIFATPSGGASTNNLYIYDNSGGPTTINTNGYTCTAQVGILAGTGGGITKSGTGTLIYSAANTYTSATAISSGTLKLGNTSAFAGGAISMSANTILDLNGYNNTISNITSSNTSATITDNSGVAGTTTLNITALTTKISSLITDGATRTVAIRIANSNLTAELFQMTNLNTFSGGLTLADGSGSGTRCRVFNTITGTPFGSGTIYIGESATDNAGFMFDTQSNTISNAVVFNTALGTDRPGIRIDNSVTITFSGTITANLANALFSTNGDGNALITGKITGTYGLEIDNSYGNATGIAVTLNNSGAANDYAGSTIIDASKCTLTLGAANQIPNGAGKGDVTLNGTLNLGGYSETINGLSGSGYLDGVSGTPTITIGDNNATSTFSGIIQNTTGTLAVTKTGSGTLTLSGASTYSGTSTINQGTIALSGGNNRLPSTTTVAFNAALANNPTTVLALGTINQTIAQLTFPDLASTTATVTGSGTSTLTINGAYDLEVGTGGAVGSAYAYLLDLSGLPNFVFNSSTNNFRVGLKSTVVSNSVAPGTFTMTLAAANTITAANLFLADQCASSNGGTATLNMGAANTFNVGNIYVAYASRSNGVMQFSSASSAATFRNTNGTSAVTNWNVGYVATYNATTWTATVDLSNGTVDALVGTMIIGAASDVIATRLGTVNATFTLGAGTLTATSITVGNFYDGGGSTAAGTLAANGTLTINHASAILNATTLTLGTNTVTPANGTQTVSATVNLTAGTLNATTIQKGSQTGTATLTQAFNWTNGTIANLSSSNLTITDVPIALAAGTHTFDIASSYTGTVNANSIISGASGITKTSAGTLVLTAANTYSGLTTVSAGILKLGSSTALGSVAAGTIVDNGAALDLNGITYANAEPLTINGSGISSGGAILNSNATPATYPGAIYLASASTIKTDNQITLSGNITNNQHFTKTGTNSLIFANNTVTVNNLALSAGTLDGATSTVNIYGDFTSAGTFIPNANGVVMLGAGVQTLPAVSFNNLTINNAAGVNLGGNISVAGTLTLTDGIVNTGAFTIDLGTNGTIVETALNPTSYVIGKVKATRTLTTGSPTSTFGGMGLSLTEANIASNVYEVIRTTGTACVGMDGNQSILRYFTIDPVTDVGLNATMAFTYFDHEITGHTEANLNIFKSTDGRVTWSRFHPTVNAATNTLTLASITSFSDWTASDGENESLPIQLVEFEAIATEQGIQLEWTTASETNNDYFTLERSTDGINWVWIAMAKGAGNSNALLSYEATDYEMPLENTYYRLQQTDYDGTTTYSKIISVQNTFTAKPNNVIYYKKSEKAIILEFEEPYKTNATYIEIIGLNGNVIATFNSFSPTIQASNIAKGTYYVYVQHGKTFTAQRILIK